MRTVRRPRRYIAAHWLLLLRPALRYSSSREAYILRLIGRDRGPVLRVDRRSSRAFDWVDRRHTRAA